MKTKRNKIVNSNIVVDDPINDPISDPISDPINDPINERQKKIIKLLSTNGRATKKTIAAKLGLSVETIKREISILIQHKLIERIGSNKAGYWRVIS